MPYPDGFVPAYADGHATDPDLAPPGFPGYTGAPATAKTAPDGSLWCCEMGRIGDVFGNWVWIVRGDTVERVVGVFGETRGILDYDEVPNALIITYPSPSGLVRAVVCPDWLTAEMLVRIYAPPIGRS